MLYVKHILKFTERFPIECRKTKSKVITLPITTDANNAMNQSELEAVYVTGVKHGGVATGFSFTPGPSCIKRNAGR